MREPHLGQCPPARWHPWLQLVIPIGYDFRDTRIPLIAWPRSDPDDMKRTQRVYQKEKPQDNSDDLQRLAFDEHRHNVIDDVEDKPGDKKRDECGDHCIYMVVEGGVSPFLLD